MFRDGTGYVLHVKDRLHELMCYNLLEEVVVARKTNHILSIISSWTCSIFTTKQC